MKLESLQLELKRTQERAKKLQTQIANREKAVYTGLPRKVGLKSIDELINALAPYASSAMRAKFESRSSSTSQPAAATSTQTGTKSAPAKSSKRVLGQYSNDLKKTVRLAMEKGVDGRSISREHNIPYATLKKWKKRWGLTSQRAPAKKK